MKETKNNFFKKSILPILNANGLNTYFVKIIKHHYADFKGRCSRKDFWSFFMFFSIIYIFLACIDILTLEKNGALSLIFSISVFIPGIAIIVRRMHDTGKSWAWALIGLIPSVGNIVLIFMLCLGSEVNANAWGEPQEPFQNFTPKKVVQNS